MDLVSILLVAVGLAMDAFAVSISCGLFLSSPKRINALRLATAFGGFQALMPILGYTGARFLANYIQQYDHWLAFGLLAGIGLKMIIESIRSTGCEQIVDATSARVILVLSLATSIDALAVGISFAFLNVQILMAAVLIGLITFGISLTGVLIGHRLGCYFGRKVEIAGGLVLIGIGIKILLEHLS